MSIWLTVPRPPLPADSYSANLDEEIQVRVDPDGELVGADPDTTQLAKDPSFIRTVIQVLRDEVLRLEEEVRRLKTKL